MIRAGLTGGYATGKSFVAAEFAKLGCEVICADTLGHAVLARSGEAYLPVIERFGPEILDAEGSIDRKRLGALVFSSPALLAELEAIVHPAVFRAEQSIVDQLPAHSIVIYEAAILIETGRYKQYDRLIVTVATLELQLARGAARDGLSADQIKARISRQISHEERRRFADFVIDTSGTEDSVVRQVHQVYEELKRLSEGQSKH